MRFVVVTIDPHIEQHSCCGPNLHTHTHALRRNFYRIPYDWRRNACPAFDWKKKHSFNEYTNHLDQPLPSFQVFVSRLRAGKHSIPALLKLSGHTAFMQRTPETRVNRLRFPRFKPPQGDPLAAVRTFHIPGCVPGFDVICSLYVVRVITALRRFLAKRYRHVSFSLSTCAMCVHHVRKKKKLC